MSTVRQALKPLNRNRHPLPPFRPAELARLRAVLAGDVTVSAEAQKKLAAAVAKVLAAKERAEKLHQGPFAQATLPGLEADASPLPPTTLPTVQAAPAPVVPATDAADAAGAGKVGPLKVIPVSPPRPPRVALPPAAVATELAVQRRQEAALALELSTHSDEACSTDGGAAYRCANPACSEPLRALSAADVARKAECTAGCVLRFHAGSCAHCSGAEAAWAAESGAPCPTPGCTGVMLYAAKMDGDRVAKFHYGADAKAKADEAEKTRKKAAAAAAAVVPTAKQVKGTSSKAVQPKAAAVQAVSVEAMPAIAAAVVPSSPRASASELAARSVAYIIPARAERELPASKAAPRRRAAAPPMQPRGLASPPASGAATPIPGTSRLLKAAYDDDDFNTTSSEDDELIEQAGRCASSPDGSFIGCEDDDDDVASPASLYRGAAAGSEAAKLGAILADHRCAVFSQAAQRTWAHEAAFHAGMQQAAKLRVAVPTRLVGYDAAVQQPMQTPLAAAVASSVIASSPPLAQAAPVLRFGAAPYQHPLHKTVLCVVWLARGSCPHGEACGFAHGYAELRTTKGWTSAPRCFFFDTPRGCRHGDACRFTHA